ncbi:hypothetical protein L195_g043509 [Trifolium pratense]|uniref:Retrovirus-related Pol polyprotein from transposon TNT 1-94 n=1 Tax=Trifolium pratense TaxID=57577 RepID=A0A2K3M9F4_TRIPR|nr:hypothetical protein L195_g043509 [Trifolium pratense]
MVLHLNPRYLSLKIGEKSGKRIVGCGRENSRSKSKGRYKNVECNYCHKSEHIHKYCFQWRKDNKGKKGKHKQRDHEDHDDDRVTTATNYDLVILRDHESVNLVPDESMWIIDSGVTLHVTPRKEFFTSYTSGDLTPCVKVYIDTKSYPFIFI